MFISFYFFSDIIWFQWLGQISHLNFPCPCDFYVLFLLPSFRQSEGNDVMGLWIKHRGGRSLRASQRAYTIGESTTTQTTYDGWLLGTLIFISQVLPDFCIREVPSLLCFCMFCFCLFGSILLLQFFLLHLCLPRSPLALEDFFSFLYIFSECFH